MRNRRITATITVLMIILGGGGICEITQAREMGSQQLNPSQLNPLRSDDIKGLGKKGGGETPDPPADPYCARGSVGPITHQTVTKACKVNGQDGVKTCYQKSVKCLSGPGEPEYAHSENCGPCVAAPTQPGQSQTPTGQ